MPRSRNIKPGFFCNEYLAELPLEARLLFIGLWTLADREGRLDDRPKKIRVQVFPYEFYDVSECLDGLQTLGFVTRYESGGSRFIQVNNWLKHQRPHHKEVNSVIPEMETTVKSDGCASTAQARLNVGSSTAQRWIKESDSSPLIPDSLNLIPDSLNLIPDSLNLIPDPLHLIPEKTAQKIAPVSETAKEKAKAKRAETKQAEADFEIWWELYPRKQGKKPALKKWMQIRPDFDTLMTALELQVVDDFKYNGGRQTEFISYGAKYLHQEFWTDPIELATKPETVYTKPEVKSQSFKIFDPNAKIAEVPGVNPYGDN